MIEPQPGLCTRTHTTSYQEPDPKGGPAFTRLSPIARPRLYRIAHSERIIEIWRAPKFNLGQLPRNEGSPYQHRSSFVLTVLDGPERSCQVKVEQ
jgi:hypothetical protein